MLNFNDTAGVSELLRRGIKPDSDMLADMALLPVFGIDPRPLMREILDHGYDYANTDGFPGRYNNTALHSFLSNEKYAAAEVWAEVGRERELFLDTRDMQGKTGLMIAALMRQQGTVYELLRGGADPSLTDEKDRNVLHFAAVQGNREVMNTLLSWTSSYRYESLLPMLTQKDDKGRTPADYARGDKELTRAMLEGIALDPDRHRDAALNMPVQKVREDDKLYMRCLLGQPAVLGMLGRMERNITSGGHSAENLGGIMGTLAKLAQMVTGRWS